MNTNNVVRVVIKGTTYIRDVLNDTLYDLINPNKIVGHYKEGETPVIYDEIDTHTGFVDWYRKETPEGYLVEQGEWNDKKFGRVSDLKIGNQSYFVTSYNVVYDNDDNSIMRPVGIWEQDTETFIKFPELDDSRDDWTDEDWNNNELTKQTLINAARYMVLNKMVLA